MSSDGIHPPRLSSWICQSPSTVPPALDCSTSARHRIRHGIRHTAALAGRGLRPSVANDCLRYMRIGYARVSQADGSQSLDRAPVGQIRRRDPRIRQRARTDSNRWSLSTHAVPVAAGSVFVSLLYPLRPCAPKVSSASTTTLPSTAWLSLPRSRTPSPQTWECSRAATSTSCASRRAATPGASVTCTGAPAPPVAVHHPTGGRSTWRSHCATPLVVAWPLRCRTEGRLRSSTTRCR